MRQAQQFPETAAYNFDYGLVAQVAPAHKGRMRQAQQFPETAAYNFDYGPVAQVDRAAVS
jgi:hypothetical protein